eukprot:Clim_evm71s150 gene=Clim_evmTU71s150
MALEKWYRQANAPLAAAVPPTLFAVRTSEVQTQAPGSPSLARCREAEKDPMNSMVFRGQFIEF